MPNGDRVAGCRTHGEAHPARDVLTEVDDRASARTRGDRDGCQFLDSPDRLSGRLGQGIERPLEQLNLRPGAVVESRFAPPRRFEPGIDDLAVVEARPDERTSRCTERLVRHDRLHPIRVLQHELRPECGPIAVMVALALPAEPPERPAFAHDGTERVLAVTDERGDVVARDREAVADTKSTPVRAPRLRLGCH